MFLTVIVGGATFTFETLHAFVPRTGPLDHAGLGQPLCMADLRYTELAACHDTEMSAPDTPMGSPTWTLYRPGSNQHARFLGTRLSDKSSLTTVFSLRQFQERKT